MKAHWARREKGRVVEAGREQAREARRTRFRVLVARLLTEERKVFRLEFVQQRIHRVASPQSPLFRGRDDEYEDVKGADVDAAERSQELWGHAVQRERKASRGSGGASSENNDGHIPTCQSLPAKAILAVESAVCSDNQKPSKAQESDAPKLLASHYGVPESVQVFSCAHSSARACTF
jgi:hypothetical protein